MSLEQSGFEKSFFEFRTSVKVTLHLTVLYSNLHYNY